MSVSAEEAEAESTDFKFRKGANWIPENIRTLMQWVHISAIYIDILGETTKMYKRTLRGHTILSLMLSSLAGTASLSQFNLNEKDNPVISTILKVFFTVMTIVIALSNGYLKVYEIQDKLEKQIRLQQQWIQFGSTITSEMQLPVHLRKDAIYLIMTMTDTYTTLFKQYINANRRIMAKVAEKNGITADNLTLSDLFERVIESEAHRVKIMIPRDFGSKTAVTDDAPPKAEEDFTDFTVPPEEGPAPPAPAATHAPAPRRAFRLKSMVKSESGRLDIAIPARKKMTDILQQPCVPALESELSTYSPIERVGSILAEKHRRVAAAAAAKARARLSTISSVSSEYSEASQTLNKNKRIEI